MYVIIKLYETIYFCKWPEIKKEFSDHKTPGNDHMLKNFQKKSQWPLYISNYPPKNWITIKSGRSYTHKSGRIDCWVIMYVKYVFKCTLLEKWRDMTILKTLKSIFWTLFDTVWGKQTKILKYFMPLWIDFQLVKWTNTFVLIK